MQGEMGPGDLQAVSRDQPVSTHGTEVTPGSDVVGEDFQGDGLGHRSGLSSRNQYRRACRRSQRERPYPPPNPIASSRRREDPPPKGAGESRTSVPAPPGLSRRPRTELGTSLSASVPPRDAAETPLKSRKPPLK